MNRIAGALAAAGFEPFVPHADGMEFAQLHPYLADAGYDADEVGRFLHQAIFALDTYQVVCGCGSLALNMNGRVPDEGAVSEAAMAWMLGKPIVIFKADCRSKVAGRDNPLVAGLADFETIEELDQLGPRLAERYIELAPEQEHELPCPPHLQRTLAAGGELWRRLESLGTARPLPELAQIVVELFATPVAGSLGSPTGE
jgi:hypothetical protein